MIHSVIFDMDGLMFDTERLSNEAFYEAQEELGITVDPQMLNSMKGVNKEGCERIMRSYFGEDADLEHYRKVRRKYFDEYLAKYGVPVKKGLKSLLTFLKENHYKIILATSTPEAEATKHLKMAEVYHYFDGLVFGNMVSKSKPAPDIFLKAVEMSGFKAEECLVLEDSYNGIEAGFAAGCHVIMVPDTIAPNQRMKDICNEIVESLEDVLEILKSQAFENSIIIR